MRRRKKNATYRHTHSRTKALSKLFANQKIITRIWVALILFNDNAERKKKKIKNSVFFFSLFFRVKTQPIIQLYSLILNLLRRLINLLYDGKTRSTCIRRSLSIPNSPRLRKLVLTKFIRLYWAIVGFMLVTGVLMRYNIQCTKCIHCSMCILYCEHYEIV